MSEHVLWETIEEQKQKITELENLLDFRSSQLAQKDEEIAKLKENTKALLEVINQREQRGLEVQEDLLKEIKNLKDSYRKQRNKRIDDLQKENLKLSKQLDLFQKESSSQQILEQEETIRVLREQIEEMKLCQNCKHEMKDYIEKPCRDCSRCLGDIKREGNTDKWELADE